MLKSGKERRLRTRFIAVFFGAVMLPSLVMAYLGLRYIRQEEQRQEQIVMRGLQVTLADISGKAEEFINEHVSRIFESLDTSVLSAKRPDPEKIYGFAEENPLAEEVFLLDQNRQIVFPRSFQNKAESNNLQKKLSLELWQYIISGERSEAAGNCEEANGYYVAGSNKCRNSRENLSFLIRIARCQFKTGNFEKAFRLYRKVLNDDAGHFYGEEVPYPIIATFQLVNILDKKENHKGAFDVLFDLYGKMLTSFQLFGEQQFQYYLEKVHEELNTHLKYAGENVPDLLKRLQNTEELYMLEPAKNKLTLSNILPVIDLELRSKLEKDRIHYTSIETTSDSTVLIAFKDMDLEGEMYREVGIKLCSSCIEELISGFVSGSDIGENLKVILLNNQNLPVDLSETDNSYITEETLDFLEGNMPDFKLVVLGRSGSSLKGITSGGVRFYYVLIGAIILVISLGVYFIFHDISREQELAGMKSDFISNVTHEIKTPIATIRSLAENVSEGWVTSGEKQQYYFRLIASESEKLGHLVENTLDFSRIESGSKRYFMENCSVQELIDKTIQRFRVLTEGQKIDLSVEIQKNIPAIKLDRSAMEQVLLNLLDNAVKYSPDKKVIKVGIKTEEGFLNISVSDRGTGIERKDRERIFEKFYRSESSQGRKITGSGIGLTLVKEIVEAHGGKIVIESERNRGSTFIIRLLINQK